MKIYRKGVLPSALRMGKIKNLSLKLSIALILFYIVQLPANTVFSQAKLRFNYENAPLKTVFKEIKKQTGYTFFYSTLEVDDTKKVALRANDEPIGAILERLAQKANVDYAINGKQIVLNKREAKKATPIEEEQQELVGRVTDENGAPLPGANVLVVGTNVGTQTDFDGNFTLTMPEGATSIKVSYIGFKPQEVNVEGKASVEVILVEDAAQLDDVVIIGTRNANRTAVDTPVPVDVLDVSELAETAPQITVTEILNYAAPSFTSNPQAISDGTDHIAPASLRGLGPDQVLVLINGKRRHKTALVNVNGTFGRGSVGTDMTTIPTNAISRIEILRDGAAAQYGSDAIAGVINIVLNTSVNELSVDVTTGANFTSESSPQKNIDGEKVNVGLNYGLPIGEDGGFINFTGNFNYRGWTNRMQEWEGTIFNQYNAIERVANDAGYDVSLLLDDNLSDIFQYAGAAGISLTGSETKEELQGILGADATDSELVARNLQRSDFNMRVGQSELRGAQFFANMSIPLDETLELYGNGGLSFKTGNAAGFYRLPNQSRTYTPAYLNGFLPEINSNITDQSYAIGIRGVIGDGWNVDFSNTFGQNSFQYRITNSNNASLGNSTPFEADSGGFSYNENTTNFDMNRYYDDVMAGLNIAFGAEYRVENYSIIAGEEASYAQYDRTGKPNDPYDDVVRNSDGDVLNSLGQTEEQFGLTNPDEEFVGQANPNQDVLVPTDFFGNTRPGGIQVFPGFKPENEVNAFRNSVAGYFDLEADFTESFLVSGAIRYENFSDFGGTTNFKLATRIKASDNFNIRGGLQTGFRAPSLHQIHFNSTSTIFVDGIPNEVGIFSNTSRVARILGIEPLKQETSFGITAGFTARIPNANLKFTVDGFMVDIKDRVILTGQFDDNGDDELATLFAQANASRAAFFANSVDTKTTGVDVVVDHNARLTEKISLKNTLAFTIAETSVEEVKVPEAIAAAGLEDTYFDPTSRIFLESAVPTTKGNLSHNLRVGDKWNFFLRNSYFGQVEEATNNDDPTVDTTFGAKIVTDLSIGHNISEAMRITLGANNLLDVYPDENDPAFRSSGRFIYSRRSVQFGTNGRHLFARLTFKVQ